MQTLVPGATASELVGTLQQISGAETLHMRVDRTWDLVLRKLQRDHGLWPGQI